MIKKAIAHPFFKGELMWRIFVYLGFGLLFGYFIGSRSVLLSLYLANDERLMEFWIALIEARELRKHKNGKSDK